MKILQIIPYFTVIRGGDVAVAYNLSGHLVKRGHDVTILTTDFEFDKEYAKTIEKEGVKVIPFHCINIVLFLISPSMKKWLKRNIKNFDIIHLHDFRSYQNYIAHYYAKKHMIPYVLQAHGSLPRIIEKQKLKKLYDRILGYRLLKDASKVIALTKTEAEQYKEMGVDKAKIINVPNGINLLEYGKLPEKGGFRRKYEIKDDEKIVLYIGRLHKTKGIDLLGEAFSEVSKELDNVILVLGGPDDGYRSALEELIKALKVDDKVLFTGFVTPEEKKAVLVDADVFVLPSFLGFPVTFLEACACGTPIITTNNGDTLDWIHGKVGYVVEYDKDQLRDAIYKVLSDEGLRKRFGEEGKKLMVKKFAWDNIVKEVENVYEGVIV